MCATSGIFKKMPKVNNRPTGENPPNLVALVAVLHHRLNFFPLNSTPNSTRKVLEPN
jgi:hypothetical protein